MPKGEIKIAVKCTEAARVTGGAVRATFHTPENRGSLSLHGTGIEGAESLEPDVTYDVTFTPRPK